MKEQLISFETAKLAKEKGFISRSHYYQIDEDNENKGDLVDLVGFPLHSNNEEGNYYEAPTQSLLQKWLREIYKIEVLVYCNASGWMWELNKAFHTDWFSGGTSIIWFNENGPNASGEWDTYEEALEAGLIEGLKLIKINKMRTNKELLKILLANIDKLRRGLCGLSMMLEHEKIITITEKVSIISYISYNKPKKWSKLYGDGPDKDIIAYYWEQGAKEPRVRWLKYHIKICKS